MHVYAGIRRIHGRRRGGASVGRRPPWKIKKRKKKKNSNKFERKKCTNKILSCKRPHCMLCKEFSSQKAPCYVLIFYSKRPPCYALNFQLKRPPLLSVKFVPKKAPILCVKFSPKKAPPC